MDYEKELDNLRTAQKNAAIADLQNTKNTSLSNLQAEESKIRPEYAAQRSTANANNRVAARNFQEYLANTGRANSGIGAQYEMSRQNSLQNGLNAINAAEAQSLADIARRRSDAENAYNTGIAGANAQVEANYINNLLAQRQQQWEREFAQKQFDEQVRQYNLNRQDELNRLAMQYANSGGGSSRSSGGSRSSSSSKSSKTSSGTTSASVSPVSSAVGAGLSSAFNNASSNKSSLSGAISGAMAKINSNNNAIQNAAQPGERYVKFVGGEQQIWMKTSNGKDYRVS